MTDAAIEVAEVVAPHPVLYPADPQEMVELAARQAKILAAAIEEQKLYAAIAGKKHILVEGWTLLGAMVGVFPVTEWSRPVILPRDGVPTEGFESRCIARHLASGETVGAAEGMCMRSEKRWATAEDHALRSMAETRARSKALRGPLDFIVRLAGFMSTPAEEMPADATVTDAQVTQLEQWGERIAALPDAGKRKEAAALVKTVTEGRRINRLTEEVADRVLDLLEQREGWFVAVEAGRDPEAESEPF